MVVAMKAGDKQTCRELCFALVANSALGVSCHLWVHPTAFSYCVLLPQLFGLTWLMYFFDYVPHRPHKVKRGHATHIFF